MRDLRSLSRRELRAMLRHMPKSGHFSAARTRIEDELFMRQYRTYNVMIWLSAIILCLGVWAMVGGLLGLMEVPH